MQCIDKGSAGGGKRALPDDCAIHQEILSIRYHLISGESISSNIGYENHLYKPKN
jgi:hypothetical protein